MIPLFQRPYVWQQDVQWEPFWADVQNVADQLLEVSEGELPPHFLGAIVLDQQWGPAGFITERHVIDGQQRLTTLQVLLDAAQDIARRHGDPQDASALEGQTRNNPAIARDDHDVFKVWPTNYDRPAFRAAMEGRDTTEVQDHLIVRAHAYFRDEIEDWADVEGDPDKARSRLHALTRALLQHLKMVVIDLEKGDNAQVIFETLNHRGTPLLAADLVKNRVFQMALADGVDAEDLYERIWKPFDSKDWRREIQRGRLRRPRIDVFLYYWLAMRKRRVIAEDRLFIEFDTLLRNEADVVSTVEDFAESAKVYERLETFAPHTIEGTFHYRVLDVLEAHVWGPVLLRLFRWSESEIPRDQRQLALKALESYLVRRAATRMTAKQANRLMSDLLLELDKSGPAQAGEVVLEFLASQTSESELWPDDAQVNEALRTFPLYRQLKRSRLRMVLEALEDSARSPKTEEEHCPRTKLTIEHIMPQGWREHWRLEADGDAGALAASSRDAMVHTLGNLTLVTDRLNPSLSNRPWHDATAAERGLGELGKRSILNQHSVLHLNKEIVDRWPQRWDEDAISERLETLHRRFTRVWQSADAMRKQ